MQEKMKQKTNTQCQCWSEAEVILKPLHGLAGVTKPRAECTPDGDSRDLEQLQVCSTEGRGDKSLGRQGQPEIISLGGTAKVPVLEKKTLDKKELGPSWCLCI